MISNRKIILSNLAARYHKRHGWGLLMLHKYLDASSKGFIVKDINTEDEYYILDTGSNIDVDKLLADFPDVEVVPFGDEEKNKSKRELLLSRNWG